MKKRSQWFARIAAVVLAGTMAVSYTQLDVYKRQGMGWITPRDTGTCPMLGLWKGQNKTGRRMTKVER